jgi:chromosome segregation protein
VLDEVDAALDESNSIRFAQILEKLSHRTQFITISHNRATMQNASLMYGVTMGDDGASRLLSVKMEDVDQIVRNKKPIEQK